MINKVTGIWDLETANKHGGHKHDEGLLRAILDIYPAPIKAADLGCGDGWYAMKLAEAGWKVDAYEGSEEMLANGLYKDMMIVDLSLKRPIGVGYDFVLCIEVGEHIPEAREQFFLDNVAGFCTNHLVISWALPKQGGRGHFNEKPFEYVNDQISKRGFILSPSVTENLRNAANLKWLKRTVAAYGRVG